MIEQLESYGVVYVLISIGIFLGVKAFNRVIDKIDELIKTVNTLRIDWIKLSMKLEDHEKRIKKLER